MPEIALFGLIGAILNFIIVNIYLFFLHRKFKSNQFKQLNLNLLQVNKFWSIERSDLVNIDELIIKDIDPNHEFKHSEIDTDPSLILNKIIELDYKKAMKSYFIFGTFIIFLSWIGLIFFLIYVISIHWVAQSRLELKLFKTDLINKSYSKDNVITILNEKMIQI